MHSNTYGIWIKFCHFWFSNLGATKKIQNFIKPVIVMYVGILVEFASQMLSKVCIFPLIIHKS